MKTADEMFRDLGYTKSDNHPEFDEDNDDKNMFVTQDWRQIRYLAQEIIGGRKYWQEFSFEFYPNSPRITCRGGTGDFIPNYCSIPAIPLSPKEAQAIYKKCEELGWLKDKEDKQK